MDRAPRARAARGAITERAESDRPAHGWPATRARSPAGRRSRPGCRLDRVPSRPECRRARAPSRPACRPVRRGCPAGWWSAASPPTARVARRAVRRTGGLLGDRGPVDPGLAVRLAGGVGRHPVAVLPGQAGDLRIAEVARAVSGSSLGSASPRSGPPPGSSSVNSTGVTTSIASRTNPPGRSGQHAGRAGADHACRRGRGRHADLGDEAHARDPGQGRPPPGDRGDDDRGPLDRPGSARRGRGTRPAGVRAAVAAPRRRP